MAENSNSRNEHGSNPETVIEVDPSETSQERIQNLDAEGNDLWNALNRQIGSMDCIICSII